MASYARENLIRTLELSAELPAQAHRAFLPLIDAELYLEDLQKYNFEVFDKQLNAQSYVHLPLRLQKAAANGKFTHYDLKHYAT